MVTEGAQKEKVVMKKELAVAQDRMANQTTHIKYAVDKNNRLLREKDNQLNREQETSRLGCWSKKETPGGEGGAEGEREKSGETPASSCRGEGHLSPAGAPKNKRITFRLHSVE